MATKPGPLMENIPLFPRSSTGKVSSEISIGDANIHDILLAIPPVFLYAHRKSEMTRKRWASRDEKKGKKKVK